VTERPVTADDLPALAGLLVAAEQAATGRPSRLGADDVRAWLHRVDLPTDSWLLEEDGRVVAAGWVHLRGGGLGSASGFVRPEDAGRGLGGRLVDRSEARLRELGVERVHQGALLDPAADALLRSRGYREVRRFYEMTVAFEAEPPAPAMPAGIELEPFVEEDARAFHAALDESFRDHWEHNSRPFDEWWGLHRSSPAFDPTLWLVARAGQEIAGVALNAAASDGGHVGALGVRRPWRGRGIARALLLQSFLEFRRRGWRRASLGVDAASPTGATRLYESVGMEVELEEVVYEKLLA
jgi:mycothiol synthase